MENTEQAKVQNELVIADSKINLHAITNASHYFFEYQHAFQICLLHQVLFAEVF